MDAISAPVTIRRCLPGRTAAPACSSDKTLFVIDDVRHLAVQVEDEAHAVRGFGDAQVGIAVVELAALNGDPEVQVSVQMLGQSAQVLVRDAPLLQDLLDPAKRRIPQALDLRLCECALGHW